VARHTSPSEIIILYYLTIPFGIGSKSSFLILLSLKKKLLSGFLSRKKQASKNKQKYYSGETIHLKIINI
ncbi:hypothetical protein R9O99_07555, partial [Escherichia coli]